MSPEQIRNHLNIETMEEAMIIYKLSNYEDTYLKCPPVPPDKRGPIQVVAVHRTKKPRLDGCRIAWRAHTTPSAFTDLRYKDDFSDDAESDGE